MLRYFILYKEKCLDFFEGMWSFIIYDKKKENFFLSRDRFGEKPFHIFETKEGFYFGSEISFIKQLYGKKILVNQSKIIDYLSLGYKSIYKYPGSFYKGIKSVPASHFYYGKVKKKFKTKKYWNLKYKQNKNLSLNQCIKLTKKKLIDSIGLRLRADVPVAVCLSGGVDSSIIASVAVKKFKKKIQTFSIIDSDKRYDERANITHNLNNIKCKGNFIKLEREKNLNRISKMIKSRSEPFATTTYYIHSHLMNAVNKKKHKVCLLGTAADELFAGYYDHYLLQLHDIKNDKLLFKKHTLDFKKHIKKFIRNPNLQSTNKYIINPNDTDHIFDDRDILEKFLLKKTKKDYIELKQTKSLLRNRMLNELFKEITPVILNQDDLNSMYYSVENRSPFLDKKLVEFAFTIPSKFLIKDGFNKYILRNAFKNIVSPKILKDRKKIGFNASVNTIFDLKNKNMRKILLDKKSPVFKYVKREQVKKLLEKDYFPNSISKFFFNFINAKIFLEQNK